MKLAALIISTIIIAAILIWQAPRAYPATKATLEQRKQRQQHTIRHDRDVLRFFTRHRKQAQTRIGKREILFHRAQLTWTRRELKETLAALRVLATPWPAWWYQQALCIHQHEGAWNANTGNGYHGGMQFLLSTWRSVGGRGYPHLASPREQLYRAWLVWRRDGGSWHEWGTAGMCGA